MIDKCDDSQINMDHMVVLLLACFLKKKMNELFNKDQTFLYLISSNLN